MKQRKNSTDPQVPVDPNVTLNANDLLPGDQIPTFNNQAPPQQTQVTQSSNQQVIIKEPDNSVDQDIPDLHKLEGVPSANRRAEIAESVMKQFDGLNKVEEFENKIRKDVEEAQKKKFEGVPKSPKDILKSLIAKGEYTKEYELFGQKWTLRALDQNDTLLALEEIKDDYETQSGRLMAMLFGTVVYCIEAINGIPVYQWFDDIKLSNYKDRMEYHVAVRKALRLYLEAMPPVVLDAIYDKYTELDLERQEALNELKNS